MNKLITIFAVTMLLSSCFGKHNSDAPQAAVNEQNTENRNLTGDTTKIDLRKSTVHWKGTKMRGTGKHEGEIEFIEGYFVTENNQLKGGSFTIDMSTISVTDIPQHEPVPRKRLNDHLKSLDFFDVEKFPTSQFNITNVKKITSDSLMISGNLTLKDITKNIEFGANYKGKLFTTKFTLDRFKWNIAYEGNLADKTLVDKDIELTIDLMM